MDKERVLHDKIGKLQLKLLDFHEKISPTKNKLEKRKLMDPNKIQAQTEDLQVESTKLQYSILKFLLYILCSFSFPTLVYSVEGHCPLFWHATIISPFITLMIFVFLSYKMQKVMCHLYKIFFGTHNQVKIVIQKADYLGSRRKYLFISATLILLVILALNFWARENDMPTLFNLCLVAGGFVCGILSVNMYTFWKEPKQLPYFSPLMTKRKQTDSSSPRKDFPERGMKCSSLSPIKYNMSPEKSFTCTELPDLTSGSLLVPEHQKAVPRTQKQTHSH